jgi:hypothetical protein
MANENSLSSHPFFSDTQQSEEPTTGARARDLTIPLNESAKIPPVPTGTEVFKDVFKSIVSEGAKGAAGALGGGIGSLETFAVKDLPEMARGAALSVGEKLDLLSPQERDIMGAQPLPWLRQEEDPNAPKFMRDRQEMTRRGYLSPLSGNPTYKGVTEVFKPLMEKAGMSALSYKPQTTPGKVTGAAAEFAGQSILGPLSTTVGRMATGAGAGAGAETLALSADKDNEAIARLTGSLAGGVGASIAAGVVGKLVSGLRTAVSPGSVAEREILNALSEDIRRGKTKMSFEDLAIAHERGAPLSIADIAGDETRLVIGRYAEKTPKASEKLGDFNKAIDPLKNATATRLTQSLEDVMGAPIDAPGVKAATEASGKITLNNIYDLVRSQPKAQAIDQRPFTSLLDRPLFQEAMKRAEKTALNDPQLNIVAPKITPAKPPTEERIIQTPQGFRTFAAEPGQPQQIVPGNLSYWDQVQREMRQMAEVKRRAGENLDAASIEKARIQLLTQLDLVPGYKSARGAAFETFKSNNAPEAGYNFFKNTNAFKRKEIINSVNQMSPEQRDLFSVGFANAISEAAAGGNLSSLVKKFAKDNNFKERAVLALGQNRFDQMAGHILSENLISKLKPVPFVKEQGQMTKAAAAGAVGATAIDAAFLGGQLSPSMAISAAIGAAALGSGRLALNSMERKVADRLVDLALSRDPEKIARLGTMVRQNRAVGTLMDKIAAIAAAAGSSSTVAERPARATGGAVNLHALAKAAKKHVTTSTEQLLNEHDDTVAKALEVANKHI